jgi:hypothetical protein
MLTPQLERLLMKRYNSSNSGGGGDHPNKTPPTPPLIAVTEKKKDDDDDDDDDDIEIDDEYEASAQNKTEGIKDSTRIVQLALGGNLVITTLKFSVWASCGSSAMLSEAIHSLVDSGNQALLLVGLRAATAAPDKKHPYGYGRSIYFWSLVSALGTFWLGAGVSMRNS